MTIELSTSKTTAAHATCFMRRGKRFDITSKDVLNLHDELPLGTYTADLDTQSGKYYLEQVDTLAVSGKLYGSLSKQADRIMRTFLDRPGVTGVMLNGEKGTGKTLLTKLISAKAREQPTTHGVGISTLIINQPLCGESFNTFIQSITQPLVVIFDEFEKVYESKHQQKLLTLLDGVYPSKKLFLITSNEKCRIDSHMVNRPGRVYYVLNFDGLEDQFVRGYCQDNLKDQTQLEAVSQVASLFQPLTFDMLKAIVEEMNRFDETPQQVLQVLNVKPENAGTHSYSVELTLADPTAVVKLSKETWHGNPLNENFRVLYSVQNSDDADAEAPEPESTPQYDDEDYMWGGSNYVPTSPERRRSSTKLLELNIEHLKKVEGGRFFFVGGGGERLTLTRKPDRARFDPLQVFQPTR